MSHYRVLIIGAGFSGLGMAARLLASGEQDFAVFERGPEVGGTWRDNRYPGCACDVPSHLYWYSFDPNPPEWSHVYAPQPEILAAMVDFSKRSGVRDKITFDTGISACAWDDERAQWRVTTEHGTEHTADVVISAVGQLATPGYRGIIGRESFAGDSFHSARWPEHLDLTGKRVAAIGSGASAAQIVPAIAREAEQLIVFQRTVPWVLPREDRAYTDAELRAFRENPDLRARSRAEVYAFRERMFHALEPGSEVALEAAGIARAHLEAQVPDPELRARLTPDYDFGCKRPVQSDDYLLAFSRPNVELVSHEVERITERGIVDATGVEHEVDVIIYMTGFTALAFLDTLEVTGPAGMDLHQDIWTDDAEGYLGMAIAGLPNFFTLYGPNTSTNHNSIIAMMEVQYPYLLDALEHISRVGVIEVDPDVQRRFNDTLQRDIASSVFVQGGCTSWYRSETGRVVATWWGSVEDYRERVDRFNPSEYRVLQTARLDAARL